MPGPFDRGWRRIVVAASGASLTVEHAALIEAARVAGRCHVIAINSTGLTKLPNADVLYGSDAPFWTKKIAEIRERFRGELWTSHPVAAKEHKGIHYVPLDRQEGLSRDLGKVNSGGNSGYAGVGLGYLFTPPPTDEDPVCMAMVGFDLQITNGKIHHHPDHLMPLANPSETALRVWAARFPALARDLETAGVGVILSTGPSALRCFPYVPLETILG